MAFPVLFPTLTTERLTLRQLLLSDADALFAIKGDAAVTTRYGMEPHRSPDVTRGWIERRQQSFADGDNFAWAVTLRGEDALIGSVMLWNFDPGYHCGELGYELRPAYEKRGIMTEASSSVVAYGFGTVGAYRVEATTFETNSASKKLLERLGFRHEGTLRQRIYFRGEYFDERYYGLLKSEWLKRG